MSAPKKSLYDAIAEGSGLYVVWVNGEQQTSHSQERKAQEAAAEHLAADPAANVYYDHDYRVRLDWKLALPEPGQDVASVIVDAPLEWV